MFNPRPMPAPQGFSPHPMPAQQPHPMRAPNGGFNPQPLPYPGGGQFSPHPMPAPTPAAFAQTALLRSLQQHPGWFSGGAGSQLAGTAQGLINQWHQISQQRYQSNHPGNAVAQLFAKSAAQATQAGQNQQGQTLPGHLDPSLFQGLTGGGQGYGHPVDDQPDPRAALIQGLLASLGGMGGGGGGRYA